MTEPTDLMRVLIEREGDHWRVIRQRVHTGEAATVANLDECWEYVRCVYDNDGKQIEEEE